MSLWMSHVTHTAKTVSIVIGTTCHPVYEREREREREHERAREREQERESERKKERQQELQK